MTDRLTADQLNDTDRPTADTNTDTDSLTHCSLAVGILYFATWQCLFVIHTMCQQLPHYLVAL